MDLLCGLGLVVLGGLQDKRAFMSAWVKDRLSTGEPITQDEGERFLTDIGIRPVASGTPSSGSSNPAEGGDGTPTAQRPSGQWRDWMAALQEAMLASNDKTEGGEEGQGEDAAVAPEVPRPRIAEIIQLFDHAGEGAPIASGPGPEDSVEGLEPAPAELESLPETGRSGEEEGEEQQHEEQQRCETLAPKPEETVPEPGGNTEGGDGRGQQVDEVDGEEVAEAPSPRVFEGTLLFSYVDGAAASGIIDKGEAPVHLGAGPVEGGVRSLETTEAQDDAPQQEGAAEGQQEARVAGVPDVPEAPSPRIFEVSQLFNFMDEDQDQPAESTALSGSGGPLSPGRGRRETWKVQSGAPEEAPRGKGVAVEGPGGALQAAAPAPAPAEAEEEEEGELGSFPPPFESQRVSVSPRGSLSVRKSGRSPRRSGPSPPRSSESSHIRTFSMSSGDEEEDEEGEGEGSMDDSRQIPAEILDQVKRVGYWFAFNNRMSLSQSLAMQEL